MALPITIPYTFANATTSIPLSQLDTDFTTIYAAVNGIGNGATALANVNITGGTIDNVAIGATTTSTGKFTTITATAGNITTINATTLNATTYRSDTSLTLQTNGTSTAMTIDTSQNVGIGTSSPSQKLDVNGTILAGKNGTSAGYVGLLGGDATHTGYLAFYNASGTRYAYIGYMGGSPNPYFNFETDAASSEGFRFSIAGSQAAIFDTSGNVLVGTTDAALTTGNGFKVLPSLSGGGTPGVMINTAGSNSSSSSLFVYSTGASAYRFYVRNDGAIFATNTTVQSISDERLKENIRPLEYGLEQIMALQPRRFDWKDGKGLDKKNDIGFIAQEFKTVVPEFVDESLDKADDGTSIKTVGAAGLIPILVKAIQELSAKNDALTARIAALEAK